MAASLLPAGGTDDESYRPLAEINVTPFVDVMLVLLIVFMVAAPLMMVGVPVELPRNSAAKVGQTRQPVIVSIDKDGNLFIREEQVAEGDFVARLAALHAQDGDAVVYVRGDRSVPYGRVATLMGQVGEAGFARISLIAEALPRARSR